MLTCSAAAGCKEFTDVTGTIKLQVRRCGWFTASGASGSRTAVATCIVDNDAGYVLVGGGAEIENSPIPGAVLKSSIPDPSSWTMSPLWYYTRWLARSAEFGRPNNTAHRLRAYSIGLRLVGMTAEETAGNLLWADGTDPNPGVTYTQVVPSGNVLLGRRLDRVALETPMSRRVRAQRVPARIDGQRARHRDGSRPLSSEGVCRLDQSVPTHADGVTQWGCLTSSIRETLAASGSGGYVSAALSESDTHFMVTSIGGHGFSFPDETPRRFLADLIPGLSHQGATVWSKDTNVPAAGGTFAAILEVSR